MKFCKAFLSPQNFEVLSPNLDCLALYPTQACCKCALTWEDFIFFIPSGPIYMKKLTF